MADHAVLPASETQSSGHGYIRPGTRAQKEETQDRPHLGEIEKGDTNDKYHRGNARDRVIQRAHRVNAKCVFNTKMYAPWALLYFPMIICALCDTCVHSSTTRDLRSIICRSELICELLDSQCAGCGRFVLPVVCEHIAAAQCLSHRFVAISCRRAEASLHHAFI